ncbi:hypothetical protein [Streptomyces anulatus]
MMSRGRAGAVSTVALSVAVGLAGLWRTVGALPEAKEGSDPAGVLAL